MLRALLQGQLISLLITGTGIFASILSDQNANFPMLLSFLNYLLLSLFIWRKRIVRKVFGHHDRTILANEETTSQMPIQEKEEESKNPADGGAGDSLKCTPQISRKLFGCYLSAAVVDVEANFLIIQAYNYTSITSIMLLDCFTIPCVMGLSYFFLGCRFNNRHFTGVWLCLLGLICIVISDARSHEQYGSAPFFGDLLCLLGSGLYAASNVLQEYLVKYHDRDEYLGFIGICGSGISLIQIICLNYNQLRRTKFTRRIMLSIYGFVSCLFLMYINTSAFLQYGDSTLFNLSLLTSDIYAVIFSYLFYDYLVDWLYFVAFGLVASGLVIYHSAEPPSQRNENRMRAIDQRSVSYNPIDCTSQCPEIGNESQDYSDDSHILTVLPSSSSSISLTKTLVESVRNKSNER